MLRTPKPLPSRAQQSFAPPILAQANAPYFTQNAQVTALQHRQGALFFDNGTSDHRLLPQAVLHRYYRNALRNSFASNTVRYGSEGTGYELRCALAEMLRNNRGLAGPGWFRRPGPGSANAASKVRHRILFKPCE